MLLSEHPELQLLREKCKEQDAVTSTAACQALVTLVETGVLSIPNALSMFISMLPYFKTHVGVTAALSQLLVLDLKMRLCPESSYKCPFNLQSPQHPLLTVLKQSKSAWQDVINQISFLCHHPEEIVRKNSSELVRPVVLYVICDPSSSSPESLLYRQQLWALLISLPDTELLEACLPWLQVEESSSAQSLYTQLSASLKFRSVQENRLLSKPDIALNLATLADTLVRNGKDPWLTLQSLNDMLDGCCVFTGSCVIMILSTTILKTPHIYLSAIIHSCSRVIDQQLCVPLAGHMLTAAILPWLAYPSILMSQPLLDAQTLLSKMHKLDGISMAEAPFASHQSPVAHLFVRLYIVASSWPGSPSNIVSWLSQLASAGTALSFKYNLVLGALLIQTASPESVSSACLSALLTLSNTVPELGTSLLTWLLYRLAREQNPNSQLELLKALPLLGKQKENVTLVIHTLESLRGKSYLRPLLLSLYLKLWHQEPRCFPYLHKLLLEESTVEETHWNIARAATMKEICEARPSQHGTELVPLLSNILNKCISYEAALPSSLALQAIAALCRAKVVDVATTWRTLAPRMSRDTRVPVIKSLCEILGLVSDVRSSNPDQIKLFIEAQSKLWNYVHNHNNVEVIEAALKALSQFSADQINLKTMPPSYRHGLSLPPEYAKTPIDAARKPEDVLPYVPGECWIQLVAAVPAATTLLQELLSMEVSTMRGALSHQSGRAEPALPRLPPDSVCFALLSYLKKNRESSEPVLLSCLQVLAHKLPKQLPPCDWSFLLELAKQEKHRIWCLRVAAAQAHTSPSAQAVVESLIKPLYSETAECDDILMGFSILGDLCKGVSPNILRPFVVTAVQTSLAAAQVKEGAGDFSFFCKLLGYIKSALEKEDIHEANRQLLSILLESLLDQISLDNDKVFSCYIESVCELPGKFLERMSSPSVWWEVTSIKLRKAIYIRSCLASRTDSDTPLVWLNECIDAAATSPREQELLLVKLVEVLAVGRHRQTSRDWLLQLMGRVQAALTSSDKRSEAVFLCDVFTLTVIVLAGHDCLAVNSRSLAENRATRLAFLPQALQSLLDAPMWNNISAQMIEWLHHVVKSSVTGSEVTQELYCCLQAMRHSSPMHQPGTWQRIVTM